jgi:hypothetical protein
MATTRHLISILATELDVPRARVDRIAHHLQRTSVLPGSGKDAPPITCDHAAAMLIAVLATGDFSAHAPFAVNVYGQLPARGIHLRGPAGGGRHLTDFVPIENVPVPAGLGPEFVGLTRDLRSALTGMIFLASSDTPEAHEIALPRSINVSRDTALPMASIELCPMPDEPNTDRALFFYLADEDFDASRPAAARLKVSATVGGHVVKALGRLLAKKGPSGRAPVNVAGNCPVEA